MLSRFCSCWVGVRGWGGAGGEGVRGGERERERFLGTVTTQRVMIANGWLVMGSMTCI